MENELMIIEKETKDVVRIAGKMIINDQQKYNDCANFLRNIKGLQASVKSTFTPIVKKAHEVHREAKAQEKKHLDPLLEAERIVKGKSMVWYREQERIRQEEEARIQRETDAKEAKRKADLEKQAQKWKDKGNTEKAEERREQIEQVHIPQAPVVPTFEKPQGQTVKKIWKFRIFDENIIPREYLAVDEKKIGAYVRAMKGTASIPGVQVYTEDNLNVRA